MYEKRDESEATTSQRQKKKFKLSHYNVLLLSNAEVQLCHFIKQFISANERI